SFYTRDGSFLRMRLLPSGRRTVESGDGVTHEFEPVGNNWRLRRIHNAYKTTAGQPLNYVEVTYPPTAAARPGATAVWQLNDSEGRTPYVCFLNQSVDGDPVPMVDRVVLAGFNENAIYQFSYATNQEVSESCQDTVPNDPQAPLPTFEVPFLEEVKL